MLESWALIIGYCWGRCSSAEAVFAVPVGAPLGAIGSQPGPGPLLQLRMQSGCSWYFRAPSCHSRVA